MQNIVRQFGQNDGSDQGQRRSSRWVRTCITGFTRLLFPPLCRCCSVWLADGEPALCESCRRTRFEPSSLRGGSLDSLVMPWYMLFRVAVWNFDRSLLGPGTGEACTLCGSRCGGCRSLLTDSGSCTAAPCTRNPTRVQSGGTDCRRSLQGLRMAVVAAGQAGSADRYKEPDRARSERAQAQSGGGVRLEWQTTAGTGAAGHCG